MNINHVLVRSADLPTMIAFGVDVLGLTEGPRPSFPFEGAWLYSDDRPLIHVIQDSSVPDDLGALDHVALEDVDYDALMERLKNHKQYVKKVVPGEDILQVFIAGPDGFKVEVQFPLEGKDIGDCDESYSVA